MVNKLAKGKRAEREFEKYLQEQGYATWKPRWSRYGKKDAFGIADIIAISNSTILFVQVKTNPSDFYKARHLAREFMKDKTIQDFAVVVALKEHGSIYRIWLVDYTMQESDWRVDIRTGEKILKR